MPRSAPTWPGRRTWSSPTRAGPIAWRIEMNPDSTSSLNFYGNQKNLLFGLGSKDDRAGLTYYDAAGQPRINFGVGPDQSPGLRMYDGHVKSSRLSLAVLPVNNGTPLVSLIDKRGTDRIGFVMTNDDTPMLGLRDPAGTDRAIVGIRNDGYPIMVMNGRGGGERVAVAVAPDETSFIRLKGANDQPIFNAP